MEKNITSTDELKDLSINSLSDINESFNITEETEKTQEIMDSSADPFSSVVKTLTEGQLQELIQNRRTIMRQLKRMILIR